jgi:hypothetical protein
VIDATLPLPDVIGTVIALVRSLAQEGAAEAAARQGQRDTGFLLARPA